MPTYDFECPDCSYRFEQRRSFSDESSVSCPKCRCEARKLFSPVPIIFKGSGFYVTDHRGNNSGSAPAENAKPGETAKDKAASADID